ncbi:MAG TPA: NBR1-Ig-like domain-containing protein [Anaerolineales bacterium]|nr:NBR1-Ig-like domain-containing protein [Anaerolineales bacterium]
MLVRKFPRPVLLILLIATLTLAACNAGATPAPTVDINAINTAAVATAMAQISAQLTQTALAMPTNTSVPTDTAIPLATLALPTAGGDSSTPGGALPTLSFNTTPNTTPLAGFTPIAPSGPTAFLGDSCHNSSYVADVTIPDNAVLQPGVDFEKIWRVQNTGTCTWDEGYTLVFFAGDQALDPENFEIERSADFVAGGETADIGVNLTAPNTPGTYGATWRMQTDAGVFFGQVLTVIIEVR